MKSLQPKHIYEFGPFCLDATERELRREGELVPLTPKLFDILFVLVQNGGHILEKDELMKAVWPDTVVEETNITRNVSTLRKLLGESPNEHQYIETIPWRGYRFVGVIRTAAEPGEELIIEEHSRSTIVMEQSEQVDAEIVRVRDANGQRLLARQIKTTLPTFSSKQVFLAAGAGIFLLVMAGLLWRSSHKPEPPVLTEKDTILLTDFDNRTGDQVFDGTLKQALAVQLQQTPFLNLFPEDGVRATLRYMGRSPDEHVTREVGREICQRQGLKAMLVGTIASFGRNYAITLEAINGQTGETIASQEREAEGKEQVLRTLQQATTELRAKLGESLSLIQKFDVPLMQATTSSLEAFKAYTLAREEGFRGDSPSAIPFFKRAIELDPNFALAYSGLGTMYANLDEHDLAVEYTKKAFALREHASERERLLLSSRYYHTVTGELDKAIETLEVWKRSYPRDYTPVNNLGFAYEKMGDLEKAAAEYRAAIPLNPLPALHYQNLARVLLYMDRREEAKVVFDEAIAKKSESTNLHLWLYEFAFELGDAAAMQHEVEWAVGKPDEARMLWEQSASALFEGKLARAEELMRRANQLAAGHQMKGEVAFGTAFLAAQAALFGKCPQASWAAPVVKDAPGRDATLMLSALAICGQNAQAKVLVEQQAKRSPTDILLNNVELPLVRALIELNDGNPRRALELLQTGAPYERTRPRINYVRGMAYLRAGQAAEAASEFQKIAGARGAEPTWPGRALAHLWLARAHALVGDTAGSRKAYQDFFALLKDADADLPLLIDAKREYQRLK